MRQPAWIFDTRSIIDTKKIKANVIPIERSLDIDNHFDLKLARYLYEK